MKRINIVILITLDPDTSEFIYTAYGNLKKACNEKGWSYSTISKQKLPYVYRGWIIDRIPIN